MGKVQDVPGTCGQCGRDGILINKKTGLCLAHCDREFDEEVKAIRHEKV